MLQPVINGETLPMLHISSRLLATDGEKITTMNSVNECWPNFKGSYVCPLMQQLVSNSSRCITDAIIHKTRTTRTLRSRHSLRFNHKHTRHPPRAKQLTRRRQRTDLRYCDSLDGDSSIISIKTSSKCVAIRLCAITAANTTFLLTTSHQNLSQHTSRWTLPSNPPNRTRKHQDISTSCRKSDDITTLGSRIRELNEHQINIEQFSSWDELESLRFHTNTTAIAFIAAFIF